MDLFTTVAIILVVLWALGLVGGLGGAVDTSVTINCGYCDTHQAYPGKKPSHRITYAIEHKLYFFISAILCASLTVEIQ